MRHRHAFLPRIAAAILWAVAVGTRPLAAQDEPGDDRAPAREAANSPRAASPDQFPIDKRKALEEEKAKKKEERKPNFEIRAVRTSPFDLAVPFLKQNHWTQFNVEVVANHEDHDVDIRTGYEQVPDSPHEIRYERRVHLVKGQDLPRRLLVMLPERRRGKEFELAIYHPDGMLPITPPGIDKQPFRQLEPDQFLIVVLAPEPEAYSFLRSFQCVLPGSMTEDNETPDKRLYYPIVFPAQPSRPLLADTALAWTTTSYVIWDDFDPGQLSVNQQDALLDWLHWGGQLIISGGKSAMMLRQSFLAPYLPADAVSTSEPIADLSALSQWYPAPQTFSNDAEKKAIHILPSKPIYAARLEPRPGARFPERTRVGDLPLVVERAVGRGRVVMTAVSLYQPELVNWRGGYDTFWARAILNVPESLPNFHRPGLERTYMRVPAHQLSGVRYAARDLGAGARSTRPAAAAPSVAVAPTAVAPTELPDPESPWQETVAEWRDGTPVAQAARQSLLDATGIEIPAPSFVLKAVLAYLIVLVPLNWGVAKFLLRRAELAWLAAPVITLAFSVGILRFAERDVGYDMTCHEIDLLEAYADYPRGDVARFTCVYSGSRRRCEFRYREASAVAMPLATGTLRRDQHIDRVRLDRGVPIAMGRYEVAPRSIGLVRAEEMTALGGPVRFRTKAGDTGDPTEEAAVPFEIENQTGLELWDARLLSTPPGGRETRRDFVGDLGPGARIEWAGPGRVRKTREAAAAAATKWHRLPLTEATQEGQAGEHSTVRELGGLDPGRVLATIETHLTEPGAHLVAWMPQPMPGQEIDPAPDRSIGFTVVLVHLRVDPPDNSKTAQPVTTGPDSLGEAGTRVPTN